MRKKTPRTPSFGLGVKLNNQIYKEIEIEIERLVGSEAPSEKPSP